MSSPFAKWEKKIEKRVYCKGLYFFNLGTAVIPTPPLVEGFFFLLNSYIFDLLIVQMFYLLLIMTNALSNTLLVKGSLSD